MQPLEIRCQLDGGVIFQGQPTMLDALLGWAVCLRDGIEPATRAEDLVPLTIPVRRSDCGQVYLATMASFERETHRLVYKNARCPLPEYQLFGLTRTIGMTAGVNKSYRIPREKAYAQADTLLWYAVGDRSETAALLSYIGYVGKGRADGHGHVRCVDGTRAWSVRVMDESELWPGFPCVRDGRPLRPLPRDWPGVEDPESYLAYGNLTFPYWLHTSETLCLMPPIQ